MNEINKEIPSITYLATKCTLIAKKDEVKKNT